MSLTRPSRERERGGGGREGGVIDGMAFACVAWAGLRGIFKRENEGK